MSFVVLNCVFVLALLCVCAFGGIFVARNSSVTLLWYISLDIIGDRQ